MESYELKVAKPSPVGEVARSGVRSGVFMKQTGIITNQKVSKIKIEKSRKFRSNMTEGEKAFWELIRNRRFNSLKFRRQQIIDGFIADFYCNEIGLVVEIDGEIHNNEIQKKYDTERNEIFFRRGLKILRFTNDDVLSQREIVIDIMNRYISGKTSPPYPSPTGEGDEVL